MTPIGEILPTIQHRPLTDEELRQENEIEAKVAGIYSMMVTTMPTQEKQSAVATYRHPDQLPHQRMRAWLYESHFKVAVGDVHLATQSIEVVDGTVVGEGKINKIANTRRTSTQGILEGWRHLGFRAEHEANCEWLDEIAETVSLIGVANEIQRRKNLAQSQGQSFWHTLLRNRPPMTNNDHIEAAQACLEQGDFYELQKHFLDLGLVRLDQITDDTLVQRTILQEIA